jgi:hypothetical protein
MQNYSAKITNNRRARQGGCNLGRAIRNLGALPVAVAAVVTMLASPASAVVTGFVNNPSSNSTDWASAVTGAGNSINSNVNFNDMSIGAFDGGFYSLAMA